MCLINNLNLQAVGNLRFVQKKILHSAELLGVTPRVDFHIDLHTLQFLRNYPNGIF